MLDQLILGLHLLSVHDGNSEASVKQCETKYWAADKHGKQHEVPCGTRVLRPAVNNENLGVYARHKPTGFGIGYVHRNSEGNESFHVDWTHNVWKNLDLTLGGATGYERASVVPVVAPSLRFGVTDKWGARVVYLPGLKGARDALHLTAEYSFAK